LISLVDYTIPSPAPTINATEFPNTPASNFWSASADVSEYSYGAWGVSFYAGVADHNGRSALLQVRLVRAGQSFSTLALSVAKTGTGSGTVTSNPAGINCGTDCTENYNVGTSVTLTAIPATGFTFAG
jgi:hypothetical protein